MDRRVYLFLEVKTICLKKKKKRPYVVVVAWSLSHVQLYDSIDDSPLGSMSMGFPRQEYWSGLPFPSPEDHPNPQTEPRSPALAGGFFITEPPGTSRRSYHGPGSVAHSCLTICTPMGCRTPAYPVLHHLPEFVQTHVH